MFLKFKQDEAKKSREGELEMAKIYANTMMHQVRYPAPSSGSNSYLQTPPQALTPSPMFGNSNPLASYGYGREHRTMFTNSTPIHYITKGYK